MVQPTLAAAPAQFHTPAIAQQDRNRFDSFESAANTGSRYFNGNKPGLFELMHASLVVAERRNRNPGFLAIGGTCLSTSAVVGYELGTAPARLFGGGLIYHSMI